MQLFTASDGTQFKDRNEWRKYEFETNYTFRNKAQETLIKGPGSICGQPFDVSDLKDCVVMLLDHTDQVQVDHVAATKMFLGPSSTSVFIRNCSDCVFTIACKQLRFRDCNNCTVYLYSFTAPIIETSSDMRFAPFNGIYRQLSKQFEEARLDPHCNLWSQVYDFNDPNKSGHNWRLLRQEEEDSDIWKLFLQQALSEEDCMSEEIVPRKCTPNGNVALDGMQSFTFDTTQEEAQQTLWNGNEPLPIFPSAFNSV
uniref:Uncharacterized protein AlNc14C373G11135 n=1 Tax=Albugo laibachii Nc14 TaxID=890382 RepID=F0WY75_9STRA|nr:conserved hypothetical protein [Albugo laibachii Nc14]|eukprot:CCA26427.1 conserved hypothetical protein [Albugo laibachii Nc14]